MNFNLVGLVESVAAKVTAAGAQVEHALPFVQLVSGAVSAVEGTGKTGGDKLTAVLNMAEVVFNNLPGIVKSFETIALDVEKFVESLVGVYNQTGVFKK